MFICGDSVCIFEEIVYVCIFEEIVYVYLRR